MGENEMSKLPKFLKPSAVYGFTRRYIELQRRSQEFDLGGYKWVKETKQPHKKFKVTDLGVAYIYRYTPVATPLSSL